MPSLTKHDDFPEGVREVLRDLGLEVDAEEFYAGVWLSIEPLPDALALVSRLRAAGLGVHLATNQHRRRADHMSQRLGYGDVFDACFYSCDLGVAKPDPAFFTLACERLTAAPAELVLVDDSEANVQAARDVGLHSFLWHHRDGPDELERRMASLGL